MGIIPSGEVADYVWTWFQGIDLGQLSDGSNVPQINHPDIALLVVAVPPLVVQHAIVASVDEKLSQIAAADFAIEQSLRRAARLRQSILKRAFEGKLTGGLEVHARDRVASGGVKGSSTRTRSHANMRSQ